MVATASSEAENPAAGDDEIIACGSPDVLVVPDEEPGVDVEFGATDPAAGALIAGSPLPGILFVEQPNAASEPVSAIAATIRSAPCSPLLFKSEFLRMFSSMFDASYEVIESKCCAPETRSHRDAQA